MQAPVYPRYGVVAQTFHWLIAVLVLTAFVLGPGGPEHRVYLPARDFERHVHSTVGLAVFVLSVLRLGWRWMTPPPAMVPMGRWMHTAARTGHLALYALLFAVPVTAVLGAWLEGHPVGLLWGWQIAAPMAPVHAWGVLVAEVHTWLGDAILWLAGGHACAAIYHHLRLKDTTLRSMLPGWIAARI